MTGQAGSVGSPPAHYASASGLQPFDVVDAYGLDYYTGCALKYLVRCGKKDSLADDLMKARHFLQEAQIRWESGKLSFPKPADNRPLPGQVAEDFGLEGNIFWAVRWLLVWREGYGKSALLSAINKVEHAIWELGT